MSKKNKIRFQFESDQTKLIPLQYGDNDAHPGMVRGTPTSQIICAYCGLGDYCQGCIDSKKPHKVQNKYVMDHNHTCSCKEGCEKCWRGLVHDFCNKVAIHTLDNLQKNGKINLKNKIDLSNHMNGFVLVPLDVSLVNYLIKGQS